MWNNLLQFFKLSIVRRVKVVIDEGRHDMEVLSKWSCSNLLVLPVNSGSFLIFKQPERIKTSRTSMVIGDGSLVRLMQSFKLRKMSLFATKIDGSMLTILVQPSISNLSRYGTCVKSGVFNNLLE